LGAAPQLVVLDTTGHLAIIGCRRGDVDSCELTGTGALLRQCAFAGPCAAEYQLTKRCHAAQILR
jgi:hypothetical protein